MSATKSLHPKSREIRLRNAAVRQGLKLHRVARRDRLALDYGIWYVTNLAGGGRVDIGRSLDEVEHWLTHPEER